MSLDFGPHPDVVFASAPLKSVVCQIRFEPVLSLMSDAGLVGFQEGLREHYPHFDTERETEIQLVGGPDGLPPDRVGLRQKAPVYRLTDESRDWNIGLAVDFVSLERSEPYTHFDDFRSRFAHILKVLDRTVHPADSLRIGLRKINVLSDKEITRPEDWRRYVNLSLLGLVGQDLPGVVGGAFSFFTLRDGEDELAVRHGLDQNQQHAYVLDLDYSTTRRIPVASTDQITELIADYSNGMTSFFHWAITDELKEKFGPGERSKVEMRQP